MLWQRHRKHSQRLVLLLDCANSGYWVSALRLLSKAEQLELSLGVQASDCSAPAVADRQLTYMPGGAVGAAVGGGEGPTGWRFGAREGGREGGREALEGLGTGGRAHPGVGGRRLGGRAGWQARQGPHAGSKPRPCGLRRHRETRRWDRAPHARACTRAHSAGSRTLPHSRAYTPSASPHALSHTGIFTQLFLSNNKWRRAPRPSAAAEHPHPHPGQGQDQPQAAGAATGPAGGGNGGGGGGGRAAERWLPGMLPSYYATWLNDSLVDYGIALRFFNCNVRAESRRRREGWVGGGWKGAMRQSGAGFGKRPVVLGRAAQGQRQDHA